MENGKWKKVKGCAVGISAAPDGTIWIVKDSGEILNSSQEEPSHL
jgi:hypothetical protein